MVMDDFVSLSKGLYSVGFTVTRNIARLEAEAYVVLGESSYILKRSGPFPDTDMWVHVSMVFAASASGYFGTVPEQPEGNRSNANDSLEWNRLRC